METLLVINITGTLKNLAVNDFLDLPLHKRYYVATVMTRLKNEIGFHYTSKRVGDQVRITRVK